MQSTRLRVMAVILSGAVLLAAPAAQAQHWHRGWHGHRGHGAAGAFIGGALVGVGLGALLGSAAAPPPAVYAPPPPPPPPTYYGYGPPGYGY